MDFDEDPIDSIYTSPEPPAQVASSSTSASAEGFGRPIPRTHGSRVSKAQKSLTFKGKNANPTRSLPRRPRRATVTNAESKVPDWTVQRMRGKCPPFNGNSGWIHDHSNRRIYTYGGLPPGSRAEIPTSDFYVCDTTTMEWKNITNSFKFRDAYNPFSRDPRHQKLNPLPQLTEPACAIVYIDNRSLLIIFGGYDIDAETASSKIIVVDLDHLEWWYVQLELEGQDVEARIEPAIAFINGKLYVFGGYRKLDYRDPQPFNSYSIGEFQQDGRWHWSVRDQPYSNIVPQGHLFGRAIPVYNGAKLLLTPGRVCSQHGGIQFKEDNLFYYHIANKRFQLVDITGDLPTDVLWYEIIPALQPACTPSPVERGRPRKAPSNSPSTTNTTVAVTQPTPSTSSSPSLIVCAWIPIRDDEAAPELWQLFLTPDERIDRLNIAQQVFELNYDIQWFMSVDGKMRLIGYDDGRSGDMDTSDGEQDPNDWKMDRGAKWNVFLDVPIPNAN
ncbi:hypothetical protein M413DRAFT_445315 [Hebeloma cylindrosporum]|uniref:Uncharacterized protein n=1 Tax=Hebeloma cylindrosporum TaxID=76867 RepID=A0A0C2XUF0_HEBCY|nr:hypothetical protein M413DRAFT_445315 [Hebeloma cylindrosporum h7]